MSGILYNKQRIFDTVITDEGKRQLATGKMQIKFASFTDCATFYQSDTVSGSEDAGTRIFLEAPSNLPFDKITFEADDSGKLLPFKNTEEIKILNGFIVSGSTIITSSINSLAGTVLSQSLDSFKKLQLIGTEDKFFGKSTFELNEEKLTFSITNKAPFGENDIKSIVIENAESLFSDKRLSNAINFVFLPPVKKLDQNTIGIPLGIYKRLKTSNLAQIKKEFINNLNNLEKNGFCREITFLDTSRNNNIISQFFEIGNNEVKKLDIVDFGFLENNKRIFFIGKLFIDNNEMPTFINMFSIVFEK